MAFLKKLIKGQKKPEKKQRPSTDDDPLDDPPSAADRELLKKKDTDKLSVTNDFIKDMRRNVEGLKKETSEHSRGKGKIKQLRELLEKSETTEISLTNDESHQIRTTFISMSTLDKRQYYECGDKFLISQQVPSWQDTGQTADLPVVNEKFKATVELNEKVGLWYGDITWLELDAIVCSVPSMNDVRDKASRLIDIELDTMLEMLNDGKIATTAGYFLPAKYVFHTKGPITSGKDEEQVVGKRYLSALKAMKDLGLKTLAFPCNSMGVDGLQKSVSAKVALETTRQWLEENRSYVDKIVFCAFDEQNWEAYQEVMPTIFPVRASSAPKPATLPTEILRMDNQSIQLYKKALSEGEVSVHSIRVMVVGHFGVGKTTLTRRLMEEEVDIETRDSTNGIDVHVRRCRVSLADKSWTVLKKSEKVDTVFKKLAKMLSRKSSNEDESLVKEAGLDDANGNCDNNSTSGVKTNTELKEVAHSQFQAAASDDPNYASDGELSVDTNDSVGYASHGETSIDTNDSVGERDVEVTSIENENTILKDLKEVISNMGASDDSDYADLSIWDFAGQSVFYTTHQMFLSSRAVYLLVTDISKQVDDPVKDDNCYFDSKGAESYKISDFVNFWLNSIHGYCPSDKETDVPPVILVGTHADKLNKSTKEQQGNDYFQAVRDIFKVKVSAMHVVNKDFSIDNAIIDPNLVALKKKIYEVASKQKNWGESIPVNWLTLEHALCGLRNQGLQIITREKLQDVNDAMPVPISSAEYLNLFLEFQHKSANILYFDDPDLRDNVVLDPQWLVDCLKSLITAKMFCSTRTDIRDEWKELSHDGILRPRLIDEVWQQDENQSFWNNRDHLIPLMEKLNIIAPCHSDSDTHHHLVPCMLKKPPTVVYKKSDCMSTPVLCITTKDDFLPAGIFQRLIAACITRWKISKQDQTNLIYCGYGCFDCDEFHRMKLYFRDCVIQLWVSNYIMKSPATNVCMEVKDFILQALHRINKCLSLAQLSDRELWIKCPKTDDLDNINALISVKTLQQKQHEDNKITCHKHADSHWVTCSQLLRCWYRDDRVHDYQDPLEERPTDKQVSQIATHDYQDPIEERPTDKQVSQIAKYIGKEYQQLGLELGVQQFEIDQFMSNCPNVVDRTTAILFSWRNHNGSSATFRVLKQAMIDVDIDTTKPLECMK